MKYASLLVVVFLFQRAYSQSIYSSISGGYQRIVQNSQAPSNIVNTYHQISNPWFWREENVRFTDAMNVDLSFGHFLNKHFGYEISGSYLKPFARSENDGYTRHTLSGQFYRVSAKIILLVPFKKVDVYSKLGINYAAGIMHYSQAFKNNGALPLGFEESTLAYAYTNGGSLGFHLALGTNLHVNKRIAFFAEMSAIYQSFEPSSGRMTEYTVDGVDQLSYLHDPYFSQIEFGDQSEAYYWNSNDKSQPQKLYKRNYALGGLGITLGVKYVLWTKKKEELRNELLSKTGLSRNTRNHLEKNTPLVAR